MISFCPLSCLCSWSYFFCLSWQKHPWVWGERFLQSLKTRELELKSWLGHFQVRLVWGKLTLWCLLRDEDITLSERTLPSEPWRAPPSASHILSLGPPSPTGCAAVTGCRSEHHTPPHPLRTWTRPTLPPGLARCAGKQHGWVTDYGSSIGCRRLCFCYLPLWLCRGAEYTGWVGSWSARSEVGRPGGGAPREWVRYREVGGVVWRMAGRWSDWFCRANTSSQGDTNSRTVSLWYFIFTHKHTMNFSTQDTKKSSTAKGCFFFFFKSCTREDLEAAQISKNKNIFIPDERWTTRVDLLKREACMELTGTAGAPTLPEGQVWWARPDSPRGTPPESLHCSDRCCRP